MCNFKAVRREVGSFEMQPATHDVTCLTRYRSNIAIYANVHVLVLVYISFWTFKFFRIDKFSPTSNYLHYFLDTQVFFHFRCFTHNILSNYLKFYPKCLEKSTIIFPKFVENFHDLHPKLFKIFNHFSKICSYFSLNSTKIFLNISFSKFSLKLLQLPPTLSTFTN